MNLYDTPQQAAFRSRLKDWLVQHAPGITSTSDTEAAYGAMVRWQAALYEGGWAGLSWPSEYGGQGLGPIEESILSQELALVEAPELPPLGYLGRALAAYASEEQRQRYLRPMLAGEELWCQGFSEPNAGSDLAAVRTRAVHIDEGFVVDGHKIWTSYAQFADHCLLLARTDQESERHHGLSMLVVEMRRDGIEVRPIVQSNGATEFAEVFFDGVVIPNGNVIGELGQGWQIAMSTLGYERGAVDIGYQAKFERFLRDLGPMARSHPKGSEQRRALARAAVRVEALRLHSMASLTARAAGRAPGPEASVDKLLMTSAEQELLNVAIELAGPGAFIADEPTWLDRYLYSRAASVYGGTSEIQRGILANQVLGMPR